MHTRTTIALLTVLGLAAGTAFGQNSDGPKPAQPTPSAEQQPAAPATGKAQLVFETLEHDFGRISDQKVVEYDFKFVNKGDAALKFLSEPHPSCGCTAGKPRSIKQTDTNASQMEFAPGEEGVIHVTYNPMGKHGDANQRVTLSTNDPAQPEQVLKIHAFVRTTISFDPPLISFGDVRTGESATQVVKVNGPKENDFKVTYASISKGRYIDVKVLDTKPANVDGEDVNQTTLQLTFNGTAPRGTLQAVTTVRTNNEQFPLADLQVMAEVVGDLQVLPPRINVGIIDGGQTFNKTFRVSSRSGKSFKITNVAQKNNLGQDLTIQVTPVEAGNESAYQVEVQGQGPASPSPINATITLSTDNTSDKTLEVMLNGAVRPPAAPPGQPQPTLTQPPGTTGPATAPSPRLDAPQPKIDAPKTDKPHDH